MVKKTFLLCLLFSLFACLPSDDAAKILTALNGKISVSVPKSWKEMPELHPNADIRAGDENSDIYLLVVSERREILPKGQPLEQYSEYLREAYAKPLLNVQQAGPWHVSVKGRRGLRYEIRHVSREGVPVATLHTVVESPEYFHQLVLWTNATRYSKNQTTMRQIADSFTEK
jgi:Domain of unknown function (DUF1795).